MSMDFVLKTSFATNVTLLLYDNIKGTEDFELQ
jgi:hypothetical protein